MYELHYHTFEPIFDKNSKILILGTFPSVKSREQGFYYGHKQNRFWRVISELLEEPVPQNISEKRDMLIRNRIALWDVAASCEIVGSSDSSMKNVRANDIEEVLSKTGIEQVFANGKMAAKLYEKMVYPKTGVEICTLPSTSPANASYSFERLLAEWRVILPYII